MNTATLAISTPADTQTSLCCLWVRKGFSTAACCVYERLTFHSAFSSPYLPMSFSRYGQSSGCSYCNKTRKKTGKIDHQQGVGSSPNGPYQEHITVERVCGCVYRLLVRLLWMRACLDLLEGRLAGDDHVRARVVVAVAVVGVLAWRVCPCDNTSHRKFRCMRWWTMLKAGCISGGRFL